MTKVFYILLAFFICGVSSLYAQSGDGMTPTTILSYTPGGYSVPTYEQQASSSTGTAKNTITDADATDVFPNWTYDTSGKSVYLVYTTNGSAPSKSNGTSVTGAFSNYANPNRTWKVTIPQSANVAGRTIKYVIYISNSDLASAYGRVSPAGSQGSWTEGDSYYTYVVRNTNLVGGGNWSAGGTWVSGSTPATGNTVEVRSSTVTVDADEQIASVTVLNGGTLSFSSGKTLTIGAGGSLTNNGTFTHGNGIVSFAGAGTLSGTLNLYDVKLSGGVDFGSASTVNGTMTIFSGGYVNTNPPTYATGSTLTYSNVVGYGIGTEWTAGTSSGAGVPYNVSLVNTSANFGASASYRQIRGSLSIDGTSGLTLSSAVGGDLSIAGNWTRNSGGTFVPNGREVTFNGSTDQTLTAASGLSQPWLAINKSAGNLVIASNITVSNRVRFLSGNAGKITSNNGSTFTISNTTADDNNANGIKYEGSAGQGWFYNISLIRSHGTTTGTYLFPVGTATDYRGASVNFTSAPSSSTNLTATFSAADPGFYQNFLPSPCANYWTGGYWTISSSGTPGGSYSLALNLANITGIDATARIMKRADGTSTWAIAGTYGSLASNVLSHSSISGFSQFGIGSNSATLPVELSSFSATTKANNVQLNWKTATEINNYGFSVQRSTDKNSWETLSFVKGAGNSNSPLEYSYTDKNLANGTYYYRLRQQDNDGSVKYYAAQGVTVANAVKFQLEQNYPNPFNPTTRISYSIPSAGQVHLVVYNAIGQVVKTFTNTYGDAGTYAVTFDASTLPSGMYFYKIDAGSFSETKKMLLIK